jgi:ABC transporter ATM
MNKADNASSTVAVDSLLNYEVIPWLSITLVSGPLFYPLILASSYQSYFSCVQTVKYFNNEKFEVQKYDKYLKSENIYRFILVTSVIIDLKCTAVYVFCSPI